MRISPVQNYYRTNYTNQISASKEKQPLAEAKAQTSVSYFTKPSNVLSFMGIQSTTMELVKKIPLEDRLASMFEILKQGDLLITGKDLKSAQKALKESVKAFSTAIKRFIFVPDDGVEGTIAFARGFYGDLLVTNPNKFNMEYRVSNEFKLFKSGDTLYLSEGDAIKIKDKEIPIKEKPAFDLSVSRCMFAQSYDLTKSVLTAIAQRNIQSIQALSKFSTGVKAPKKLTFADVGGQDDVINQLKKGILYPVKYPEAYENSIVNHGFIMYGPPGTGKTLIAQALANESNANFIKLNGLEMESKWVGESEANWRALFNAAKESQPAIIFIDEFDAVARKRGSVDVYGDKVVNQLLTLMSDIEKDGDQIYVITATNKVNALDDAITRSGRFGKHIEVKAPETLEGVNKILDIHTKTKKLDEGLDKAALSKKLLDIKATGADIAHIVNTANENAFERCGIYEKMDNGTFEKSDIDNLKITFEDFVKAIDVFLRKADKSDRKPIGFNKVH